MREIKFRAWNNTTKAMKSNRQTLELMSLGNTWEYPIMQYTGLKDKNGVEIYEGDIIKAKTYPFYGDAPEMENGKENPIELNYVGLVGIDVDGVYYDLKVVSDRVRGSAGGSNLSEINEFCEVIGNIYENKELLND